MKNGVCRMVRQAKLECKIREALLLCFALASAEVAFGFYNPQIGRWMTRDPIEEEDSANLYQFVGNNPITFFDPFGLKRWIIFYYSRAGQEEFKRAAQTAKRDIENKTGFNPKCDAVLLKGASSVSGFQDAWNEALKETTGSDPNLKVVEAHLFTHSAPGVIYLWGEILSAMQIKELPKLNWADDGQIISHGCNSGLWDASGDSVAGSFANGQGVKAMGQTGYSQFSESPDKRTIFTRVGPDSKSVYLWSYGDGGPRWTFGAARQPYVFEPEENGGR